MCIYIYICIYIVRLRYCKHCEQIGEVRVSRNFAVVIHPLRLHLHEVSEHGRGEVHAQFQSNWFAKLDVPDDRTFYLLGEWFGHDLGQRARAAISLFYIYFLSWKQW